MTTARDSFPTSPLRNRVEVECSCWITDVIYFYEFVIFLLSIIIYIVIYKYCIFM